MKPEHRLEQLAARARQEASPDVDVTDNVMAALKRSGSREVAALRALADRADERPPPETDVTRGVMSALRRRWVTRRAPSGALGWVAGASAAVAVPLVVAAAMVWNTWVDPVVGVFHDSPWLIP